MNIRFLTAEDANEWSRLRLEALNGDPEAFSSSVEEHHALPPGEIKRRLGSSAENSFVVGAFEDDRLVGIAGFVREKGPKTRHKGRSGASTSHRNTEGEASRGKCSGRFSSERSASKAWSKS